MVNSCTLIGTGIGYKGFLRISNLDLMQIYITPLLYQINLKICLDYDIDIFLIAYHNLFPCHFPKTHHLITILKFNCIYNIKMLVQNSQIHDSLRINKQKIAITQQQPLIVLLSNQSSFLNYFCQTIIKYYKINAITKIVNTKMTMDYTLPFISFRDYILQKQGLIQFLCDIALSKYDIVEYTQRKENIKKIYRNWSAIFNQQQYSFSQKRQLEDLKNIQLPNKIFEELLSFSVNILNKNYDNSYKNYAKDDFRLEIVMMIDVIDTIMKDFPKYKSDYVLRGYFEKQIDFCINEKRKYEMLEGQQYLQFAILVDKSQRNNILKQKWNTNLKWFLATLIGLSFIFGKWAK